ncbi:MAG: DinB family protein [Planctomycetota bacterium]
MRTRLVTALDRIRDSRAMTERMIDGVEPHEWFWQPGEGLGSIGWHLGHMAFAQYFLCLKRLRGRTEEDCEMIPTAFLKRYKQGSTPKGGAENNESIDVILSTLAAVHERALVELAERTDAELDVPSSPPHPIFTTKLGAIEWCSQHEMMHNGQIALLRRLLGKPPRW